MMQKQLNIKCQAVRTCTQERHKAQIPQHVCTFDKCSLMNRWVCCQCVLDQIHKHGLETSEHIMAEEIFLQFIQKKEQHKIKYYNEMLTQIEQFINELNKLTKEIILQLQNETIRIREENNINLIEDSIKKIKEDFQILSNEQIIKLVNIKQTVIYFDDWMIRKFMEQQNTLFQDFMVLMQKATPKKLQIQEEQPQQNQIIKQNNFVQASIQVNQHDETIQIDLIRCSNEFQQRLLQLNPQIKITSFQERHRSQDSFYRQQQQPIINGRIQILPTDQRPRVSQIIPKNQQLKYNLETYIKLNDKINTVFISYDGQLLILGQNNGYIQIHDLLQDKIVKTIKICNIVIICIFDNASNYLACGDSKGYLFIYCLKEDFKLIYNKKIHNSIILNMKFINQMQLITCSDDKNVIITNFIDNQQVIKLQSQQESYIQDIEYDENAQIIISSFNKTINFFSLMDITILFNQLNAHDDIVYNIQLIPKDNCLITSNLKVIKLWRIDYQNKQLKNLEIFQFQNQQSSFLQISHKANFVFVVEKLNDYDTNANQKQTIDESFWLYEFINKSQITKYIIFLKSDFKQNQGLQIFKQEEISQRKQ